MAYHDCMSNDDMPRQQASDGPENSEFTFMVTTFMIPGTVEACGNHDLLKQYGELIAPISGKHGGAELGSYAGRTVTCFKNAQDAVRAAVELQSAVDEKNLTGSSNMPVLARIALHTGQGFCDPFEQQWEGVAEALRCASVVRGGEVLLTDVTLQNLDDLNEFHGLLPQPVPVQRADVRSCNVLFSNTLHRVVWSPTERHINIAAAQVAAREAAGLRLLRLIKPMAVALPIMVLLYVVFSMVESSSRFSSATTRTIHQRVNQPNQ